MKFYVGKLSLILRLGTVAGVLLFGQQAMAIGTAAGTSIDNTVTVDFEVAGVDQTDLTSTVSFVVDRRVDFTLVAQGTQLIEVTPGETDSFFDFLLTNDSNSPLDFSLVLTELAGGLVRGATDNADMGLVDFAVSAASVGAAVGADPDPVRGGAQFVDQLAADDSIRIRVFGDAALTMTNGQIAGVQLDAIGREPGSAAATALTEDPNVDATVENVFADADNDNLESDVDGWTVVTADLTVSMSYVVIDDGLGLATNSGLPIPGATVEYTIVVVNASATNADAVRLDDVLTELGGAVSLVLNAYPNGAANEDLSVVNDTATLTCNVEDNADGDGCDLNATTITVGSPDLAAGLVVAGNTTLTITYQVTIEDPDPTP